ncbi:hypothetical protein TWF730_010154 [Orbilia blumenaviensis]|uniref:Uncharacterized protein n=1 Tax=Orbilia blumenaviensis TaxID=1796055 RepID=A0AAV9UMW9_9PEZI
MAAPKIVQMPVYVQGPPPGVPIPNIIPQLHNSPPGYFCGHPTAPVIMQATGLNAHGAAHGWPIYVQGGSSSNPQFAYYPVPAGGNPQAAIPPVLPGKKHRKRQSKQSDDGGKCGCDDCVQAHGKRSVSSHTSSDSPPSPQAPPHLHPGHFIPPQFYGPPAATQQQQQTTTFIPYVVPACSGHQCGSKSTRSDSNPSTSHKNHTKKSSDTSYHYAEACDCPTCKARRTAIEMERLKNERKHEREYKDAHDFLKAKERVDREQREASFEEMYRTTKKAAGKKVTLQEPNVCHHTHPESESEYEWVAFPSVTVPNVGCPHVTVPNVGCSHAPFPITAFHPDGSNPITLQPLHSSFGPWIGSHNLEEENFRLRQEKDRLKDKIRRERSLRNKDENTRDFLSSRLHDLDEDVRELKKKTRHAHGGSGGCKAPIVEIQVPLPKDKHHHNGSPPSKTKGGSAKGSGGAKSKGKTDGSKHKHPHVCFDSDCDEFDSCSECSFECDLKGCRTCRPRGGRH